MDMIKKGQVVIFTEDEYEDYCIKALAVAISDFELESKQSEWEADHTELVPRYGVKPEKKVKGTAFLPWLRSQGLLGDVDYVEINTTSHGKVEVNLYNND